MRAFVDHDAVVFKPDRCCRKMNYEYELLTTGRGGKITEAWVYLRCRECNKTTKIIAYAKMAGDGDATGRQHNYRNNSERKAVAPSTAIRVQIVEPNQA